MPTIYMIDSKGRYAICEKSKCTRRRHGHGLCNTHYHEETFWGGEDRSRRFDLCPKCHNRKYLISLGHGMCGVCWANTHSRKNNKHTTNNVPYTWTDDAFLASVKAWADEHDGYAPLAADWSPPPAGTSYPNARIVCKGLSSNFGSFNGLIDAAIEKYGVKRLPNARKTGYTVETCRAQGIEFINEYGLVPSRRKWNRIVGKPHSNVVAKLHEGWTNFTDILNEELQRQQTTTRSTSWMNALRNAGKQ